MSHSNNNELINNDLRIQSRALKLTNSKFSSNILYANVVNTIRFTANVYDIKNLVLSANWGQLKKEKEYYTWKICN
jgi:hypothetical protein